MNKCELTSYDLIVVGAGAAGLMAAATAGKRGRKVLLIEHTHKIGEKIRISGGGRCNFTNTNTSPKNYLSDNPHFPISALSRYTQHDFIKLVEDYKIKYHEKTLGQLFCDGASTDIINMLVEECKNCGVTFMLGCLINDISKPEKFEINTNIGNYTSHSLIIATGGLSIPKLGASDFGYNMGKQFGHNIIDLRPALVPLKVEDNNLEFYKSLSGISVSSIVMHNKISFKENILFTHRGLSGPAILQISSYIKNLGDSITIDLLPNVDVQSLLISQKNTKTKMDNFLKNYLPNRFIDNWSITQNPKRLVDYKLSEFESITDAIHNFKVNINGNEGYAKAEVTVGGIDTKELSSKTMESNKVSNLYFIGEVVDVTGWLGGYNFQWAWSSGFAAGSYA